mgnify:CR=1 FL=1
MDEIFKLADEDSKKAIWGHLLVLYNDYDPNNETVSLLKPNVEFKANASSVFLILTPSCLLIPY